MYSSNANNDTKTRRIETETYTQTVRYCNCTVFPRSILRYFIDATIYGANFQSIRKPHRTRSSGGYHESSRQFGKCDIHAVGSIHRQTTTISVLLVKCGGLCRRSHMVWIHLFATRLHFIRSNSPQTIRIGEQGSWLHSIDLLTVVELLRFLRLQWHALDIFVRTLSI